MARRRSFVPECPNAVTLEGRLAPSSFSIGDWFSSQYKNITQDLGITHKSSKNAAAGIKYLWDNSKTLSKPTHIATTTHTTNTTHITGISTQHAIPAAKVK